MAKISNRPRRSSVYNLTGAWQLFGKSYDLIRQNFQLFMFLYAIPLLLALWDTLGRFVGDEKSDRSWHGYLNNLAFGPGNNSSFYQNASGFVFILVIPYAITQMMLAIAWLRTAQGDKPSFGQVWRELISNWLWLRLIGMFIAVIILTLVGLVLLIVPGLIVLWRLFLTPYILIDKKTTIGEAIRGSWNMTRHYGWPIYGVLLVELVLSLTNVVPVFGSLIAFLLISAYSVAPALRYQEIKKATPAA